MTEFGWELFFRTGLPQAYSFAKAEERSSNKKSKHNKKKHKQEHMLGG